MLIITIHLIVAIDLLSLVDGQLTESSRFELTSHHARGFVNHREVLKYRYNLGLMLGFTEVKVTLEVVNMAVDKTATGNELLLIFEKTNQLLTMDNIDNHTSLYTTNDGWKLNLVHDDPNGKLREIHGNITLTPADDAPLGSKLQPRLIIDFVDSYNRMGHESLLGEHIHIDIPVMEVSTPTPPEVDSKEATTVKQIITLPPGSLNRSTLAVYTPNNVTMSHDAASLYIEEPFMTATSLRLVKTNGLTHQSQEKLAQVTPVYLSNSKSSETDLITYGLPEIESAPPANGSLMFETEAESLDFIGHVPGIAMVLCSVLQIDETFFIVEGTPIMSADHHPEIERKPALRITSKQLSIYNTTDRSQMLMTVGLEHMPESWASVYNISLLLYLPPFLISEISIGKYSDVLKSSRKWASSQGDHVLQFELRRLSFAHQLRIQFNVTMDTDNKTYQQSDASSILVEAVCDGWRDGLEYAFPGTIQLKIPYQKRREIITPHESMACMCSPDGTASCTCKHDIDCFTGGDDAMCVDCNRPWDCIRTLPEHGTISSLVSTNGSEYRCPPASRHVQPDRDHHCVEMKEGNCIRRLPMRLGTLLGEDSRTGNLYGISKNGRAYMISQDDGISWAAVSDDMYVSVSTLDDFVRARFRTPSIDQ